MMVWSILVPSKVERSFASIEPNIVDKQNREANAPRSLRATNGKAEQISSAFLHRNVMVLIDDWFIDFIQLAASPDSMLQS